MFKKMSLFLLFVGMLQVNTANAVSVVSSTVKGWWNANSATSSGAPYDFILSQRTDGVRGNLLGFVARNIVEHGAEFCPYSVYCEIDNNWNRNSWTLYRRPKGFSEKQCVWLCENGYGGQNCTANKTELNFCDPLSLDVGSVDRGINKLSYSPLSTKNYEFEIKAFKTWYYKHDKENDTVLGIVRFLDHGVVAAPVRMECEEYDRRDKSKFSTVALVSEGKEKILCADGYILNSSQDDCVPIDAELCDLQYSTLCSGFDENDYDSTIHKLVNMGEGCVKYFCSEPGFAFTSATDKSCSFCAVENKGGPSADTGLCVECKTGEFFNTATNACESASSFTTSDLQYGKGKTKNSYTEASVTEQCWTKTTPDEYADCVKGLNLIKFNALPVDYFGNTNIDFLDATELNEANNRIKNTNLSGIYN